MATKTMVDDHDDDDDNERGGNVDDDNSDDGDNGEDEVGDDDQDSDGDGDSVAQRVRRLCRHRARAHAPRGKIPKTAEMLSKMRREMHDFAAPLFREAMAVVLAAACRGAALKS